MTRWRDQRREGKLADVAAEVLVSTLRFLTALSSTTSIAVRGVADASEGDDDETRWRKEVAQRWTAIGPISNEFIKAWELAETYLPDEVNELLERVWDERAEILSNQQTYFATPVRHAAEFHKGGFGSVPEKRLKALRVEARKILRPLAQHAYDETTKRAAAERELEGIEPPQLPPGK